MYNEPLSIHATGVDFNNSKLTRAQLISYVQEKTANNPPGRTHIRSTDIVDIIIGSPYVVVVEVTELVRLSSGTNDWFDTDIYHSTIIHSLKGEMQIGTDLEIIFNANTVKTGELHIVAIEWSFEGSAFHILTSKNSLFSIYQLDEIMQVIAISDEE